MRWLKNIFSYLPSFLVVVLQKQKPPIHKQWSGGSRQSQRIVCLFDILGSPPDHLGQEIFAINNKKGTTCAPYLIISDALSRVLTPHHQ